MRDGRVVVLVMPIVTIYHIHRITMSCVKGVWVLRWADYLSSLYPLLSCSAE